MFHIFKIVSAVENERLRIWPMFKGGCSYINVFSP